MKFNSIVNYVIEPDLGESDIIVPILLTAELSQTFDRNVIINIDALEEGIYVIDNNLIRLSLQNFTIPADFTGKFYDVYLNATVIGNNEFHGNMRIFTVFTSQSYLSTIIIIPCNSLLIYDDDG